MEQPAAALSVPDTATLMVTKPVTQVGQQVPWRHLLEYILISQLLTGHLSRLCVALQMETWELALVVPLHIQAGYGLDALHCKLSHRCCCQLCSRSTLAALGQHGATAIKPRGQ